jgi:hypothetical protein
LDGVCGECAPDAGADKTGDRQALAGGGCDVPAVGVVRVAGLDAGGTSEAGNSAAGGERNADRDFRRIDRKLGDKPLGSSDLPFFFRLEHSIDRLRYFRSIWLKNDWHNCARIIYLPCTGFIDQKFIIQIGFGWDGDYCSLLIREGRIEGTTA